MTERRIGVATAARILRVSRRDVLKLIEGGKLYAHVEGHGGSYRISYASVINYMSTKQPDGGR